MPSGNAFQSVGGRWLPLKTGCISVHNLLGYNLIFYFGFGATRKQEVYIGLGGGSQLICLIYKLPQASDVQLRYDLGSTQIIGYLTSLTRLLRHNRILGELHLTQLLLVIWQKMVFAFVLLT